MEQESATQAGVSDGMDHSAVDDHVLLRAHEPVLSLTAGEYFVPVAVDGFVSQSQLFVRDLADNAVVLATPGTLDLDRLARLGTDHDGPGLSLSGITAPTTLSGRFRAWLPKPRPRFRAGSRLAQVGLVGRSIDILSRLSLFVRGTVPGGSAGDSLVAQQQHFAPDRPTYYGRVVRDNGWIVCQYWFFYSFNNWRSAFSGVNEHEGDWEQVTVYLDGSGAGGPDGLPQPRWVVFSAHDETGDDLRRRWDDPDLRTEGERHPVVFVGAGSHSGAYLPGDYLITVVPPSWGGVLPFIRRAARVVTPWARAAQGPGFGIPYIDYARGDGDTIGPGHEREWTQVVIDEHTPWVRDYRGLWGHDSRDAFGGERGPAGPRYERDTSVRASWGDPVGWAGLAKVAPNPAVELEHVETRVEQIHAELGMLNDEVEQARHDLTTRAAGLDPATPVVRAMAVRERELVTTRMRAVRLSDERAQLVREVRHGIRPTSAHSHLTHRRLPIAVAERGRARFLAVWAVVSTPLVLALLGSLFRVDSTGRQVTAVGALVIVLSVEAFGRGYLLAYIVRVLLVVALGSLVVLLLGAWQTVLWAALSTLAVLVLLVNVRDAVRR
ncbi:MAG: hypothetical protein ABI692_08070 [Terracoccus sp.]